MTDQEPRTLTRTDCLLIGVLVAIVLPLRWWLVCNTEVTARDSIGYIRYALQFESESWQEVWKENHQHPGYPMCVWWMSLPVRAIDGATTPDNMELSAQLVSLLASLVLIVPMYVLGRQFFDRTISFGGTLLYQYLPVSAHHLSDGISEPIFLVLLVSALLQMALALRERSVWHAAGCGVLAGLAYLVRPEGLLIVPTFGLALIAVQFRGEWRFSRGRFLACGVAMVLMALALGSIYVCATGRITNKLSAIETISNLWKLITPQEDGSALLRSGGLFANSFAPSPNKAVRVAQSVDAYGKEILQGLHYAGAVLAVLGFWWSFAELRRQPAFWGMCIHASVHSAILIALAMSVAYVSDRHVMILVLGSSFFAVFGLRELTRRVKALTGDSGSETPARWYRTATFWFAVLFLAWIGLCLPKAGQRLHGNRVGNHQAGLWLGKQLKAGDVIVDDHAWSHFFSGLLFEEKREPALPPKHQGTCFVVITRSNDPAMVAKRSTEYLTADAKVVYHWPEDSDLSQARVTIHAQNRDKKTHPWRELPPGTTAQAQKPLSP